MKYEVWCIPAKKYNQKEDYLVKSFSGLDLAKGFINEIFQDGNPEPDYYYVKNKITGKIEYEGRD